MKGYPAMSCVCSVLVMALFASAQSPSYNKFLLSSPTLGNQLVLLSLNNIGQVVGRAFFVSNEQSACLWTRTGGLQNLGTPSGFASSGAYAINDQEQVAGTACTTSGCDIVLWTVDGGAQDLGNLSGYSYSYPVAINDDGEIAGYTWVPSTGANEAFVWTPSGGFQDLGNLGGSLGSSVQSINDSGEVVGNSYLPGNTMSHPFEWTQSGGMQDLSSTLGDNTGVGATNDSGEIVGAETLPSRYLEAYLWTPSTGVQTLGYLSGGYESAALALNASGAIVGWGLTATGQQSGFLWTSNAGMQDLNALVFPKGNGKKIETGWSISNAGLVLTAYDGALNNLVLSPKMTVTETSSQNPSIVGQPVTFTATVNSIAGSPPDGESIIFHNNGSVILGSAPLSKGTASLTTSSLTAGTHSISAHYVGDSNYVAAPPANVSEVVNK